MTNFLLQRTAKINRLNNYIKRYFGFLILIFTLFFAFFISPEATVHAKKGLSISFEVVIPTLFPFFILSDLIVAYFKESPFDLGVFQKVTNLPAAALPALLIGSVCGFPTGAATAHSLYKGDRLTKRECERVIAISNNPSPAYLIGGIGYSTYGNERFGLSIYLSVLISSLLIDKLANFRHHNEILCDNNIKSDVNIRRFSLSDSISNAGLSSIRIASCITFFFIMSGVFSSFFGRGIIQSTILGFLELTSASISTYALNLPILAALAITSLAAGFGGLSVFMQIKAIISGSDISLGGVLLKRFLVGIISMPISVFIFTLIK